MNEDIKMLEKIVNDYKKAKPYFTEYTEIIISNIKYTDMIQALENLIARYKEVEQNYINPSKARFSYYDKGKGVEVVIEGFIPKSKVKEKIEELRNEEYDDITFKYNKIEVNGIIEVVLQELLEES